MSTKHRILITGSNGLLGQKLVSLLLLKDEVEILATAIGENRIVGLPRGRYRSMDICNRDEVLEVASVFKPTAIINTAAYTQVDGCEHQPAKCKELNVAGVSNLIDAAIQCNSKLVHLSTDFVFDGKTGNYSEEDTPNPLSIYGQSKYDSEVLIANSKLDDWVVARTIILYGVTPDRSRSNLVLWAYNALKEGKEIKVVKDQFRAPTLVEDLAAACWQMIHRDVRGIFHISGPDTYSILELVNQIAIHFKLDGSIIQPITSDALNQKANRPPITGFDISKAIDLLDYHPHTFAEGLEIIESQLNLIALS